MKEFFKKLLNSQDSTSSRRFTAMIGLLLFVSAAVCSLAGLNINTEVLYASGSLTLLCLGLTTLR